MISKQIDTIIYVHGKKERQKHTQVYVYVYMCYALKRVQKTYNKTNPKKNKRCVLSDLLLKFVLCLRLLLSWNVEKTSRQTVLGDLFGTRIVVFQKKQPFCHAVAPVGSQTFFANIRSFTRITLSMKHLRLKFAYLSANRCRGSSFPTDQYQLTLQALDSRNTW